MPYSGVLPRGVAAARSPTLLRDGFSRFNDRTCTAIATSTRPPLRLPSAFDTDQVCMASRTLSSEAIRASKQRSKIRIRAFAVNLEKLAAFHEKAIKVLKMMRSRSVLRFALLFRTD